MTDLEHPPDGMFIALVEAAPDAMVCADADGRITLVNAQAERLFGYPREELIGQPVELLVPEASRAAHPGLRAGYAGDPRPRPMGAGMELAGRRRDGTTFPAEISLSAIDTGEGPLITAAVRDVTSQRLAAERAAQLASIIQSSHDAVIGKTLDQVITSWNPGAERLYGYTAQEMIGRHVEVLIPAAERDREARMVAAVSRGERVEQYQASRVRKDGTTVEVLMTPSPILDRGGAIVGVATVTRDLTERQRADARFRALLEAAPDAMVCTDADGRIVLVNAQAERLFGYGRAELIGQPVEMLVPAQARGPHPGYRAGYVASPRPRPMGAGRKLAGLRRDGTTFPADISLSAIGTGEGLLITAAVRDITDRQQVKDLEQANRNLESFTYLVAHDLRAPLRALRGISTALLEDCRDSLGETGRDHAERIRDTSEEMARLIDDLLGFARLARAEVHLEAVDLGAEAAAVAAELKRGDPGRRATFTIQQPACARADVRLIRTVLQNLLGNAWKFTARRDDARVEFGTAPASDGRTCYYVRDNGAGFDPANAGKLFAPFQRLHPAREFPGTGIGLASVRQIIERHDGQVWAKGAVDAGATFYFTLGKKETL